MIFPQKFIDDKSLFIIIRKGEIELFYENGGEFNSMKKLGPGEIFGETSFFSNQSRTFCARSLDFSNVFIINQQDFLSILRKNKRDFERFFQIKDNINLYEDYGDLYLKCFSCLGSSHQVKDCPILHYIPKKEIVILRYLYSKDQKREGWKRVTKKSMNAFVTLCKVEKQAYKLQREIFLSQSSGTEESRNNEEHEVKENKENKEPIDKIQEYEENFERSEKIIDEESKKGSENEKTSFDSLENDEKSLKKNKKSVQKQEKKEIYKENSKSDVSETSLPSLNSNNQNTPPRTKNFKIPDQIEVELPLQIDHLKSYEVYFPGDNIERVLNRIEGMKLINLMRKKRKSTKSRKRYEMLIESSNEKNRGSIFAVQSKDSERNMNVKKENDLINIKNSNNHSPFQKNFFKTKNNIEKQILEEEFDITKLKESFRERIKRNNESSSGKLNKIVSFFTVKKKEKKKFFRVGKKENLKTVQKKI